MPPTCHRVIKEYRGAHRSQAVSYAKSKLWWLTINASHDARGPAGFFPKLRDVSTPDASGRISFAQLAAAFPRLVDLPAPLKPAAKKGTKAKTTPAAAVAVIPPISFVVAAGRLGIQSILEQRQIVLRR